MIGSILVKVAFIACLASVASYLQHRRRPSPNLLFYARALYLITVVTILATAGYLLSLILTHQFQYTYVWSYSSRELSLPLLISTFYAGQEGSFMLWTIYTGLIGVFLLRHSSRKGYEPEVMAVYGLIQLALLVMLIAKNPFKLVWDSFPGQVEAGFLPANGRGLNPLLQNYWMVIHPQVLFSGFASMGVPYAYAVAALLKRDYTRWIRPATPWLVFGATILGTGIMMGGFWAYETLGWGGYWGWDPVENSSLVPWLVAIAGIHTILAQRKTGGFVRTNLVLGMSCFFMVVYSTFLTRSGVLGDTSVHSFVDPGMMVYWLLVGMIVVFLGLGMTLLVMRWKEIPKPKSQHSYSSREFALALGSAALVATALLVTAGTSSPLITDLLYGKKSAVDITYYTTTTLPIGVLIGLLTGIGQLLWWSRSKWTEFLRSLAVPVGVALATAVVVACLVPLGFLTALFIFGAAFGLSANIMVGWRIVKGNPKFAGGAVAHIGLAVMFLGFVASSKFDEKRTISLEQGKPQSVMGYQMTYTGYHPIGNDKYAFRVHVLHEGREFTVAPIMYYSAYTDGLMRNPDVRNLISRDFYLAPLSLEQPSNIAEAGTHKVQLKLGETKKAGTVDVRFVDFEFPSDQREKMLAGQDVEIGARVQVRLPNGATMEAVPKKIMHQGQMTDKPATVASDATGSEGYEVTLGTMHPDQENRENSSVEISVKDLAAVAAAARDAAGKGDILVAEASVKPYINLVWSGVIILLVGFLITIVRRSQEATAAAEAARNPDRVEPEARDVAPELADGVQSGIA